LEKHIKNSRDTLLKTFQRKWRADIKSEIRWLKERRHFARFLGKSGGLC